MPQHDKRKREREAVARVASINRELRTLHSEGARGTQVNVNVRRLVEERSTLEDELDTQHGRDIRQRFRPSRKQRARSVSLAFRDAFRK